MKTNAPRVGTWIIALLLGLGGIIGHFSDAVKFLSTNDFWLILAGFVVLLLGTAFKGL